MRATIASALLFAGLGWADEAEDRAAVEKTISALNVRPVRAGLFACDFDDSSELAQHLQPVTTPFPVVCPEVWRETCGMFPIAVPSAPLRPIAQPTGAWGRFIVSLKIRFPSPDVALVDAVGKSPLVILLMKEGTDWKIASLRELAKK